MDITLVNHLNRVGFCMVVMRIPNVIISIGMHFM